MGIITVLWEKWIEFKRDFVKISLSAVLTPVMYLIAFGLGLRPMYEGRDYLYFLIPGLVSMTTMTASFSAVMQNMSVQRLYERALDQVLMSPTPLWQFLMGQVIGGMLRGLYGGAVILLISLPLCPGIGFNLLSLLTLSLNGCVFSSLALVLSFLAKSYADAPRFTSYIIMPMTFLCNTFFSVRKLPYFLGNILGALPLSITSDIVRSAALNEGVQMYGIFILLLYLAVLLSISFAFIYKKENL